MSRVVLDTNVLVSALLFEGSRLAWIRQSWQSGRIKSVLAEPTARELLRVLAYLKLQLKPAGIKRLRAELLPWSETWQLPLGNQNPVVAIARIRCFWIWHSPPMWKCW
jgi:hypothetical protein